MRRRGAYCLLNGHPLLFQINPKVDVLRVAGWRRFGNSVVQLRNVIYAAENLDVPAIEFSKNHKFFAGDRAGQFALTWGASQPTSAPSLEGDFFFLNAFHLSLAWRNAARIYRDYVRPLVRPEFHIPDPRLRDDDLVLHFRAGDVFAGVVNPSYGQPPLSYYLSAVEREQPARVWLVFENRSNPCINAVEEALRAHGVDVAVQSGTLADDLRFLMSARRIVASCGTFLHSVSHLSECLGKIYFFERGGSLRALRQLGVDVIKATDAYGEFKKKVLTANWANSPEQRALMLSYSSEKLAFVQLP